MERYCITLTMENALHNLRTATIISVGDALMLVAHLDQKARRVTHRFTRFFLTQVARNTRHLSDVSYVIQMCRIPSGEG